MKPEVAFDREFKKSQAISYWESGRDMSLSNDLFQSFIKYQSLIKKGFEYLSKRHAFIDLDGEASVSAVNGHLRKRIASHLGIRSTHYKPSHALAHLAVTEWLLPSNWPRLTLAPTPSASPSPGLPSAAHSNALRRTRRRASWPQRLHPPRNQLEHHRPRFPRLSRIPLQDGRIQRWRLSCRRYGCRARSQEHRRLMDRIQRKAGIELEVISGEEEARLVCSAVLWALGPRLQPRLIFDLGGGSLELNFYHGHNLEHRIGLPLGTIRLMETFGIRGAIDEENANRLRHHILALCRSAVPSAPKLTRGIAVACGGNAEALVRLAPGPLVERIPSMNMRLFRDQTWRLLSLDVPGRMRAYRVRQDRAEVMAIAAIVFLTIAKWLDIHTMLVPGVGVREGILLDLVAEQYSVALKSPEEKGRADELVNSARWFGQKMAYNSEHADQVARLALSLFDQLRPIHEKGAELRLTLEIAALLHDIGHFINRKAHHRHGEYLVRNGDLLRPARVAPRYGGRARPLPQFEIRAGPRSSLLRRSRQRAPSPRALAHEPPAHRRKVGVRTPSASKEWTFRSAVTKPFS